MAHMTISTRPVGAGPFGDALRKQLEWALPTSDSGGASTDVLQVSIESIEECERIGSVIASWVAGTTGDFSLLFDGPGAESELQMLRTEHDSHLISGLIASAAYLQ